MNVFLFITSNFRYEPRNDRSSYCVGGARAARFGRCRVGPLRRWWRPEPNTDGQPANEALRRPMHRLHQQGKPNQSR